ncbi:DUF2892 domain-containing protein [uncultured Rhodospira sp.]|uniref:YgaP family membrane protein n=1 Tax=uncultured Rhodospira sp. TaxID=1936189 RepID=UPI002612372E|nr:DUF2892 domain-containing protein [uncultured Rhodospira sp.]
MTKNVGGMDRILRIAIGAALIVVTALVPALSPWGYIIGAILAATGLLRVCPAYLPFGIKTCKSE